MTISMNDVLNSMESRRSITTSVLRKLGRNGRCGCVVVTLLRCAEANHGGWRIEFGSAEIGIGYWLLCEFHGYGNNHSLNNILWIMDDSLKMAKKRWHGIIGIIPFYIGQYCSCGMFTTYILLTISISPPNGSLDKIWEHIQRREQSQSQLQPKLSLNTLWEKWGDGPHTSWDSIERKNHIKHQFSRITYYPSSWIKNPFPNYKTMTRKRNALPLSEKVIEIETYSQFRWTLFSGSLNFQNQPTLSNVSKFDYAHKSPYSK
jgi:hypothetical protein